MWNSHSQWVHNPMQPLHSSVTQSSALIGFHSCEIFAYKCEVFLVSYSINENRVMCTPEFSINVVDRMNGYLCQPAFHVHSWYTIPTS